jgi:hypothetical protein
VRVGHRFAPEIWSKDDDRKQKEDAGYLEPKNAPYATKGAEKASYTLLQAVPRRRCGLTGRPLLRARLRCGTNCRVTHRICRVGRLSRLHTPGLRLRGKALPGDTACDAQSDAQGAPDASRSHTVYDGSSGIRRGVARAADPRLLSNGNGSKVERFHAAARSLTLMAGSAPEVAVTSRLRELIQQLGEAIHESVIESEQIAGVVQDIRKHGFDVLLMLEATIGLNEVSGKANEAERTEEGGEVGEFTPNDLHFLRSLRISVEGEPDEPPTDVK